MDQLYACIAMLPICRQISLALQLRRVLYLIYAWRVDVGSRSRTASECFHTYIFLLVINCIANLHWTLPLHGSKIENKEANIS